MSVLKLATSSAVHDVPFTCTTFAARRDQGNNLERKIINLELTPSHQAKQNLSRPGTSWKQVVCTKAWHHYTDEKSCKDEQTLDMLSIPGLKTEVSRTTHMSTNTHTSMESAPSGRGSGGLNRTIMCNICTQIDFETNEPSPQA